MSKYDSIINMPRPISKKHKPMTIENRARQFSPFDALTGYKESIFEEGRLTEKKHILTNEERLIISKKLNFIKDNIKNNYTYTFIYFVYDRKKEGGYYENIISAVKKINENDMIIVLANNTKININDIYKIESVVFQNSSF